MQGIFNPRGRLVLALAFLGVIAPAVLPSAARAQEPGAPDVPAEQLAPAPAALVDSVAVRGNQRVTTAAVRTLTGIQAGARVTAVDIQNAIRRLMATGNFETVEVLSQGDFATGVTLIFDVAERPFIADIDFRGLERVSPRTVRDTVGLKANQPLDPNLVARTQQMIRELLAKAGVQVLSIDTTLTPVSRPEGAYRLTFNVREGSRLSIADVEFRGNQAFSDGALADAMATKPEGFLWFRTGRFDQETFRSDLRSRLPNFYAERGYIDFAVVSDTLVVDPETGKARIEIEVAEGPQYRLGEFSVDGNARFPSTQLERIFAAQRRSVLGLPFGMGSSRESGEVFDRVALNAATQRVQQMYRNEGYLYAQVEPVIERVPADSAGGAPQVNVTWAISERSPFYVNKIRIEGNTFTHESVIRDRLLVFPGDVYNEERLIQSYQGISALGFFETPIPSPDINPNPETGEVDIVFYVKEKQTGNINFGTAIGGQRGGGVSGFLGYSQPNLFGQGKQADLRAEFGFRRNSFQASYTDPAISGTRNSGSVSLFHTDDRYRGFTGFTNGRAFRTGGSLQFGIPVPGIRFTRAFASYSLSRYRYEAIDEENCDITFNFFCQPSALASNLSLALTRDTKNHPLFPTAGTRQSVSIAQTGGPLGGTGDFRKLITGFEWWVPVGRLGGTQPGSRPIVFALGLQTRAGTIFGDASRFPTERFFLGGTQRGEQLRGYEELSITPFGYVDPTNRAFPGVRRLGDAFLIISGEYAVRLNDNLSISAFADAGNIWTDVGQIDPTRLFRGAGLGVTIVTPFGPLGLDYAYGFDRDEPGWKFHFKLGQGF